MTGKTRTWTGANDRAKEGQWVWDSDQSSVNVAWASGEPNDDGNEDCGDIGNVADEKFNDFKCHEKLALACQMTK